MSMMQGVELGSESDQDAQEESWIDDDSEHMMRNDDSTPSQGEFMERLVEALSARRRREAASRARIVVNDGERQNDDDDDDSMPGLLEGSSNNNENSESSAARRSALRREVHEVDSASESDDDSVPALRRRGIYDDESSSSGSSMPALLSRYHDSSDDDSDDDSQDRPRLGIKQFPQVQELSDDLVTYILSFVAEVPFEKEVGRNHNSKITSTLTDVLPLVSTRFRQLCLESANYYWRSGLERLVTHEPRLWRKGLLSIMEQPEIEKEAPAELVERAYTMVNADTYKHLFQEVLENYVRMTAFVFCMPGFVRLGQQFGIHFYEPRYQRMIAQVMEPFPETARLGEDIVPNENGDLPVFIYAHSTPLRSGSTACVVQVQHCIIHEDGTADASLIPIYYVRLERIWEVPNSGSLREASCIRLNSAESDQSRRATPFGDLDILGPDVHVGRAIDHFLAYLAAHGQPDEGRVRFAFGEDDDEDEDEDEYEEDYEEDVHGFEEEWADAEDYDDLDEDDDDDMEVIQLGLHRVGDGIERFVRLEDSDNDDSDTDEDMPSLIGGEAELDVPTREERRADPSDDAPPPVVRRTIADESARVDEGELQNRSDSGLMRGNEADDNGSHSVVFLEEVYRALQDGSMSVQGRQSPSTSRGRVRPAQEDESDADDEMPPLIA